MHWLAAIAVLSFYKVAILTCSAFLKKKRKWKTIDDTFFHVTHIFQFHTATAYPGFHGNEEHYYLLPNQEDFEVWRLRTLALRRYKENCCAQNWAEEFWDFSETGSWPELHEAWVVLTNVYYLRKV